MNKYNPPTSARHRNVKIYAELMGNHKKQRIKSLYDNKNDVEYGTGAFSSLGTGRKGYWVYVKGSDGSVKSHSPKEYTLEEAKQVMAILRSKGLEAFYTCGRKPQPFLQPALNESRDAIIEIFTEAITNAGLQNNANN